MIYFANKPDPVFTDILHGALETSIDDISLMIETDHKEMWYSSFSMCSRCFNPKTAIDVLKQLLDISKKPDLYTITDYHYLILFDCLYNFCDQFNYLAETEPEGFLELRGQKIKKIDFDWLIEIFFWDTDFAYSAETMRGLGLKLRKKMGIKKEVFGIAQGWEPHEDELKFTRTDPDCVAWDYSDPDSKHIQYIQKY